MKGRSSEHLSQRFLYGIVIKQPTLRTVAVAVFSGAVLAEDTAPNSSLRRLASVLIGAPVR